MGGAWIDAYSRDLSQDRTSGTGRTKTDRTNGYFNMTVENIRLLSNIPSGVTESLHDDPLGLDYIATSDNYMQ